MMSCAAAGQGGVVEGELGCGGGACRIIVREGWGHMRYANYGRGAGCRRRVVALGGPTEG